MADNVLETVQKLVQDVIAPDVRELKVRLESLEKRMDDRFKQVDDRFKLVDDRFTQMEKRMDERFKALEQRLETMEAMNTSQFERLISIIQNAQSLGETAALREMAPLRERVAVLEVQVKSASANSREAA